MTLSEQLSFNERVIEILDALATACGLDEQYDEPKHCIVGDPIRTKIHELRIEVYERQAVLAASD